MNVAIIKSMKRLYENGKKTKEEFIERVVDKKITPEEYKTITGEEFEG